VGTHNAHNAGTAALIVLALDMGVEADDIQAAIPYLQPPPHRMEVGKWALHVPLVSCLWPSYQL